MNNLTWIAFLIGVLVVWLVIALGIGVFERLLVVAFENRVEKEEKKITKCAIATFRKQRVFKQIYTS